MDTLNNTPPSPPQQECSHRAATGTPKIFEWCMDCGCARIWVVDQERWAPWLAPRMLALNMDALSIADRYERAKHDLSNERGRSSELRGMLGAYENDWAAGLSLFFAMQFRTLWDFIRSPYKSGTSLCHHCALAAFQRRRADG